MTTSTMEKIKVMLAFDEGKQIQYRSVNHIEVPWQDCNAPLWDWYGLNYRIKPQTPRKFTRWFITHGNTLVGPYVGKEFAETYLPIVQKTKGAEIVAFEMTEILDNAER